MKYFIKSFLVFRFILFDVNKLLVLQKRLCYWLALFDFLHLSSKVIQLPRYLNLVTCKHISAFSFPSLSHHVLYGLCYLPIDFCTTFILLGEILNLWNVFYNSSSLLSNSTILFSNLMILYHSPLILIPSPGCSRNSFIASSIYKLDNSGDAPYPCLIPFEISACSPPRPIQASGSCRATGLLSISITYP